ncbi:hypothetical protein MC7420_2804 [Coleofasciculus chthonoplastes PCC 7420]|uniref:Uncharacterized protein n=1 Tax=Coleofasciculus chthonoplastes PCC 7420 TaxID=118168 RepID=B4W3K2_9CYAN|nr:hypothetical protein [Coleofasciculus chthonoplastes]EDX71243.1 hypothetical protein MC7420_2804 [Coleofasciculus chthonoplastes PCC 7420]
MARLYNDAESPNRCVYCYNWAVKTAATQTKPACAGFHTPSFSSFCQAKFVG